MKTMQKSKKMMAAAILGATLALTPVTMRAEDEKKPQPIVEVQKKPEKAPIISLSPAYSMSGDYGTIRAAGGQKIAGIGVGGFMDFSATKENPTLVQSYFGKITASKGLDSIVKGSGVAVELTAISGGVHDQIRAGFYKAGKLGQGGYKLQFYPIAPKGKGPAVGVFVSQKIASKLDASAFITSDIGAKTYYGEAQFSYGLAKDFSLIIQERYGGKFGEPFKPATHVGFELKI